MIRVALRLALAGGRESVVRFAVTAGAVALGVALLLVTLAGINGVHSQDQRTSWLGPPDRAAPANGSDATTDPLWATVDLDQFGRKMIIRVDVAATGPRSPVPPGLAHLPGPGQFYASPAMARLLRSQPDNALQDRYPGRDIGTIGPSALASPGSLVIVIGHTVADLEPDASEISKLNTSGGGAPGDAHPSRMQLILAVVAGALLFPVLLFIAAATRLAAARREARFAAIRLVGGTPRQVSLIAAVEAAAAAAAGVAVGFALFFLVRPALAGVPFTGQPFFTGDLSLHLADTVVVAIGVPVAAAIVAQIALRRVRISPLGVSRHATPPPPRAWRLIPLLVGIGELTFFLGRRPTTTGGQIQAYGAGFLLSMIGLVVAGPWLTMVGGRAMSRRTHRPAVLIAGRRLSDNPRSAFRSVSGLIVALFICSTALGVITTILADQATSARSAIACATVTEDLGPQPNGDQASRLAAVSSALGSVRGVQAVLAMRVDPDANLSPGAGPQATVLASSAELARLPLLGHCARGATVAAGYELDVPNAVTSHSALAAPEWRTAAVSLQRLRTLPIETLYVRTDGSNAAIERTRTAIERALPYFGSPTTIGALRPENAIPIDGWKQLADVAIVASLVIAACSLAVSSAASVVERKRPFSLLRLTGTPVGVLRRVVGLEAAVPLVVVAAVSAATGLLAADLFLRSQLDEALRPPAFGYYLVVLGGIGAALAIIASTLPLLERISGPEAARND